MNDRNLVLTGFMGTGKSTVGKAIAARLGLEFVDMDQVIVQRMGKRIPDIFEQLGEAAFRALERALCLELAQQSSLVIATGGGALVDEHNRQALASSGMLVCLDCAPEEIVQRIGGDPGRPLLRGDAPERGVQALLEARQEAYGRIDYHVDTTRLTLEQVIETVIALYQASPEALVVRTPAGSYRVHIYPDGAAHLGALIQSEIGPSGIAVIADEAVWRLHGERIAAGLDKMPWSLITIPSGEEHKRLDTVRELYDGLLSARLDRQGLVVALGGGVTTDMAGFAAATYLRGVRLAQVPTTLLAMIDASVGGKVAVDLPQGKNLVGAFKQAELVLLDPAFLQTLPREALLAGLAEIIKHGLIGDAALFDRLAAGGEWPDLRWLLKRALQVKIDIVEQDPFEQGRRAVLNLGHTFAHAFEVLADYALPHGLAVSQGMAAAADLSARMRLCSAATRDRLIAALAANGLPTRHGCAPDAVIDAMQHDKKRIADRLRLVLIEDVGRVIVQDDVSTALLTETLEACQ
ncbi:MAG: 3-dehydroquinate synthase [Chloroflexi bacterium]|nr:3-dehydroquinate synthase [Chloroflexota bacterium]